MAGPELIDAYLAELRRALRRAEEAEEILAEVNDHLREVTDVHITQGMSPGSAERHALGQFGTTELVARAFRRRGEGIAMPTRFTRTGGLLWLLAPLLIGGGVVLIAQEEMTGTPSEVYWLLGTATIVAGIVVLCVGMQAMLRRHGGSIYEGGGDLGRGGQVAVFAAMGAALCVLVLAWLAVLWISLLAVSAIAFAVTLVRSGLLSRIPAALFGLGPSIVATAVVAAYLGVDDMVHHVLGPLGAMSWAIFAIGGAWLGYELWSERPVDVDGFVTGPNG